MTEPLKYAAKIAAKGLDTTGVTEAHAKDLVSRHLRGGTGNHHSLFIVEGKTSKVITDEDGNQQVVLVLTQVEPVPTAQEERVREFMRAIYRSRPEQQGQAVLSGTADGPTIEDTGSALAAVVEHDAEGNVTGVWDGSMDGPLPDLPEDAYPADATPLTEQGHQCGFPGCVLDEEHDGDHDLAEVTGGTEEGTPGQVVEFSGKTKKA